MAEWGRINRRGDVVDRRSLAPVAGGVSIVSLIVYFLFSYLSDGQVQIPIDQLQRITIPAQQETELGEFAGEDEYEVFASTVLGSNNEMWDQVFTQTSFEYNPPTLVLFRQATSSACGTATSQVGPHYCPLDETIYLDETFFDELQARFGAEGGDVAEAYVISHEVAHHAQNKLGIMDTVLSESQRNPDGANDLSIKLELQADCFAGLWANSIQHLNVLSPGEIREAMDAAQAVGDDRIQEKITGRINPENWTHGSSQQRLDWFTRGYEQGTLDACNTFK